MAQRKQIQAISIIALLALMIVLMGMVFLPYASVLLWTAVCYILVSPPVLQDPPEDGRGKAAL